MAHIITAEINSRLLVLPTPANPISPHSTEESSEECGICFEELKKQLMNAKHLVVVNTTILYA